MKKRIKVSEIKERLIKEKYDGNKNKNKITLTYGVEIVEEILKKGEGRKITLFIDGSKAYESIWTGDEGYQDYKDQAFMDSNEIIHYIITSAVMVASDKMNYDTYSH